MSKNEVRIGDLVIKDLPKLNITNAMDLIKNYKYNNDFVARETLINGILPRVASIALSITGNTQFAKELFQIGCIGLIDAINKYSFDHGAGIFTYADIRIKGSMIDYMRKYGSIIRVTHAKRKLILEIKGKMENAKTEGLILTVEDISNIYGLSINEIERLLICVDSAVSIDLNLSNDKEDDYPIRSIISDKSNEDFGRIEDMEIIKKIIKKLSSEEKRVLYFLKEGLTQKEISVLFDVSESRISQIKRKIRDKSIKYKLI